MEKLYNYILSGLANYVMMGEISSPEFTHYLRSLEPHLKRLREFYRNKNQWELFPNFHEVQAAYMISYYPQYVEMTEEILVNLREQGFLNKFDEKIKSNLLETTGSLNVCIVGFSGIPEVVALCRYIETYFPADEYGEMKGVLNIHTFDAAYSYWAMSRYLTKSYILPELCRNDYCCVYPHQLDLSIQGEWEIFQEVLQTSSLLLFPNYSQRLEEEEETSVIETLKTIVKRVSSGLIIFSNLYESELGKTILSHLQSSFQELSDLYVVEAVSPKRLVSRLSLPDGVGENLLGNEEIDFQFLAVAKDNAEFYLKRGRDRGIQGNIEGAIKDFTQAINLNPHHSVGYFVRGLAYYNQRNLEAAIEDYNQAITLNPNYAYAYYNRGNAYQKQGNLEGAIEDYNQAITLNPNYASTYYNRGLAYYNQGNLEAAIEDYNQAITLNPNDASTYYNRGLAYYNQGNLGAAIEDYNQAINLNSNYAYAYYNRGNAYYNQGNLGAAIEDYNQAINLNPNYAYVYHNRGLAHYNQENLEDAIEDYNQTIALYPNYAYAYYNRGNAYQKQGNLEAAIEDYNQAITLNPNQALFYKKRGVTRGEKGDLEGAIKDFNQAMNLDPNYAQTQESTS